MSHVWLGELPWRAPMPLPMPITTARLEVRPARVEDAGSLFAAVEADRPVLARWLPWGATGNRSLEECRATCEMFGKEAADPGLTNLVLFLIDRASGAVVGGTGLHRMRPERAEAEVGYWVRPDWFGRGVAKEGVGALVDAALRPKPDGGFGLRRVTLMTDEENVASIATARALGFREESRLVADSVEIAPPPEFTEGEGGRGVRFRNTVGFARLAGHDGGGDGV